MTQKDAGSFDELLKALNGVADEAATLAKAQPAEKPADDKVVAAAATDAGVDVAGAGAGEGTNPEDEDDEGEDFGKSLGTNEAGESLVDATELVKSLMERQDNTDGLLTKALTAMTGALGKQNELIKSLQGQVAAMGTQGRGRRTLLTVAEKPDLGEMRKSQEGAGDGQITPKDLLAKSNAAYEAKKISGAELNTVDVCLRQGWSIDAGLLTRIANA